MFKFWNAYFSLFFTWLLMVSIALVTKINFFLVASLFYTGVLPFICMVLFFSRSILGEKIRKHVKKWHFTVYVSWIIFVYSIYAQKWAAETLNSIFKVDASYLNITYKLLAFLFAPFGLFYNVFILSWINLMFVFIGFIVVTILSFFLLINAPLKSFGKFSLFFFMFFIFFSFASPLLSKLAIHKSELIKEFALWADFSEENLCTDSWTSSTRSVLFLNGKFVLAYHPYASDGYQFSVESCNYKKKF
ncbi:hypothetical protein R0K18_18565 [Pantoea sp. SIMBA_133]